MIAKSEVASVARKIIIGYLTYARVSRLKSYQINTIREKCHLLGNMWYKTNSLANYY